MELHKYTLNGIQEGHILHNMKSSWHFLIENFVSILTAFKKDQCFILDIVLFFHFELSKLMCFPFIL